MFSITTLILLMLVSSVFGVCFGTFGGFIFGTLNRVFFRYQFRGWVEQEMVTMQREFSKGVLEAENRANTMVAEAHAQTQEIYKLAAEHAMAVQLPGVKITGMGSKGPSN